MITDSGFMIRIPARTNLDQPKAQNSDLRVAAHDAFLEGDPEYFARLVNSCAAAKDLCKGKSVHARILQSTHWQNKYLANLLVQMYGRCGSLEQARVVFDAISEPNTYSWNIMVAAFAENGHLEEAKQTFDAMPQQNVVSWTTMVQAYAQHGYLSEAEELFDRMPQRNVVSWTAMVAAYAQNGDLEKARGLFDKMPERNVVSCTAMVSAYAHMGCLEEAKSMFDKMPQCDVVSWNIMLQAYAFEGHLREAHEMLCGMPQRDVVSWTGMVAAYADHGHVQRARIMFDEMPQRDIVAWNAMIAAYAQDGHCGECIDLLQMMQVEGVKPDDVTLMSILSACCHGGLLDRGLEYFSRMRNDHGVEHGIQHYCCIIGILGRAGQLNEAKEVISSMPFVPDAVVWGTLLSACGIHRHAQLGAQAAKRLSEMDPESDSSYVLLSNIYAAVGRQERTSKQAGSSKQAGGNRWKSFAAARLNLNEMLKLVHEQSPLFS